MAQSFWQEESSRPAPIMIGPHKISEYGEPYVIAEIGVNHGGCLEQAKKLIDAAREAGADAVKFQVFSASLAVPRTPTRRLSWATLRSRVRRPKSPPP